MTYRTIFREIMRQYTDQGVWLNTQNDQLSEFRLDTSLLLQENFSEEEIVRTLAMV